MVKKSLVAGTAALFMFGSAAIAQVDVDSVTADLEAEGYTNVMVLEESEAGIVLEATDPDGEVVVIEVDPETGDWSEADDT